MLSLPILLLVLALILCVGAAAGKVPLWTSVFVLVVTLLVQYWR